jgi:hypothetical protein
MTTSRIWSLMIVLVTYLPWLVVAAAGAAAFFRNKTAARGPLLLQVAGSAGAFLLGVGRWLVLWGLYVGGAPYSLSDATGTIFTFLIFMAELVFAAGYAWEKFAKPRAVGALPVT